MSENKTTLTLQHLLDACSPGGASVLTSTCELAPATGPSALIAPPRYLRGRESVYSFARRAVNGEAVHTVLIDSKGSQANRRENALAAAMRDEKHPAHEAVKRMPRFILTYEGTAHEKPMSLMDLELPHRWTDGHVRAGTHDGKPMTQDPTYRAMRDSTNADVLPIFENSPMSLVDGVWDSTRKSNQVRLRSAMVGEIFGVLAVQDEDPQPARRGGARVDPVAASVQLDGKTIQALADAQKDELSPGTYQKISKDAKNAAKTSNSGSVLGLGAVPPGLTALGGVSCTQITRNTVLSFAALRQLRFGGDTERDIAFRALLAAAAILSMSLADDELELRADCNLIETGPREVMLDGRYGARIALEPIDSVTAAQVMLDALAHADKFGLSWQGQEFHVTGDSSILRAAVEDDAEGGE